jgi:NTE family protein
MRVALVLGSGGARGYAHIGAIEVLRERGHQIVTIAGTSAGALIGGLEAAGKLPEFSNWARDLTQRDVLRLLDPAISLPGAIKAERVVGKVSEILGGARIEDLPIPFTAVAADISNRREVWLQRGPVDAAIRASIAIPSIITPVMLNGRLLADGGLLNPVPVEPTTGVQADFTLAVSLSGKNEASNRAPVKETSQSTGGVDWAERFRRSAADALDGNLVRALVSRFVPEAADGVVPPAPAMSHFEALPDDLRTADVIMLSLETMQGLIERFRLAVNPPDVLVTVPSRTCGTFDFHRARELIETGRRLTGAALDRAGY